MSSALSPPAAIPQRTSSRSARRGKRGKGKGGGGSGGSDGQEDDGDASSSRASSVSPSPSPSPSLQPKRVPSSGLAQPPLTASSTSSPNQQQSTTITTTTPSTPKKKPSSSSLASPSSSSTTSAAFQHPLPNFPFLQRVIEPKTAHVPLLNNAVSVMARHIQPAVVLAYFAARFPALVADPPAALAADAPVLALLQVAWCVACLPPYAGGSASSSASSSSSSKASLRTKSSRSRLRATPTKSPRHGNVNAASTPPSPAAAAAGGAGGGVGETGGVSYPPSSPLSSIAVIGQSEKENNPPMAARLTMAVLGSVLAGLATGPLLVLTVLFGAPATTHGAHTALLALHLALLGALPLAYAHGLGHQAWWEAAALMLPCDAVSGSAAGACVGAWLGAIPIPLDWDREWQKWPVTIVTGAYLGSIVGRYMGAYWLTGKRLRFEEFDDAPAMAAQRPQGK